MLRDWFNISKAIGFILTIAGLVLAVYFIQMALEPGPAPLPTFVVAAIALAMISVGVRYILKERAPKAPTELAAGSRELEAGVAFGIRYRSKTSKAPPDDPKE